MNKIDSKQISEALWAYKKETFSGTFKHISYEDKIDKSMEELLWTNPKDIIKWGWGAWDDILWWIYGWKIYVIGAESWSWKSTFINQIAMNLSKQGTKVTKYSLEDRLEDIWKEELFYIANRHLKKAWKTQFNWNDFNNWEYTHPSGKHFDPTHMFYIQKAKEELEKLKITELEKSKQVQVSDLIRLMKEESQKGTKVFFIDHLHYFKMNGHDRTDLEIQSIMHDINEIAREFNIAVFLVAHYKKLNWQEPDNDSFKDASAIKQVANIIINIVRDYDTNITEFRINKIRGPIKATTIEAEFDISTYTYTKFAISPFK